MGDNSQRAIILDITTIPRVAEKIDKAIIAMEVVLLAADVELRCKQCRQCNPTGFVRLPSRLCFFLLRTMFGRLEELSNACVPSRPQLSVVTKHQHVPRGYSPVVKQ